MVLARPSLSTRALAAVTASAIAALLLVGVSPLRAEGADIKVASDTFDRTLTGSWGSARVGGSWTVVGGSGLSVADGSAVASGVLPGRSFEARLDSTVELDGLLAADVAVPAQTGLYYSLIARRQPDGSFYAARLRIDAQRRLVNDLMRTDADGQVLLDQRYVGTVTPGESYRIYFAVSGTDTVTLQSRVYLNGTPIPDWQTTAEDSSASRISTAGSVGFGAYVSRSSEATDGMDITTGAFGSDGSTADEATPSPTPTTEPTGTPTTSPTTSPTAEPTTAPTTAPTAAPTTAPTAAPTTEPAPTPSPTAAPPPAPQPPAPPAPQPPAPPPPVTEPPATSTRHGSAPVGSTSYPIPANALFVSSSAGNDAAAGTIAAPLATVGRALAKATSGQTIVLRGGRYHESVIVATPVTIQAYPNEAVWFDGSRPVTGFAANGTTWSVGGWTAQFDSSPTYDKGAPDGSPTGGWQFVNPSHPMAAHPDQVWIDGQEQTQVGSLGEVQPGTFYVDYAAARLYLGSNPAGKTVEASDIATAISLRAPGTVIRGFGLRRFASSVPQQGVITSYYPRMTLENIDVRDSGTAGVGIYGVGCRLTDVTIAGSGQMGLQGQFADGLVVDNLSLVDNNDQHFNPTPAAGGMKFTETRGLTLKNSEITGTDGNAFWMDESVSDITVVNNLITDNNRWGVVLELSSRATVADNVISGNAYDGILVANTDKVSIWNNTIVGNRRAIQVSQDSRRITDLSVSGHDPRVPQPDLAMPWISRDIVLGNNILNGTTGADSILDVESWEHIFAGNDMVTGSNGNVYTQATKGAPAAVVRWSRAGSSAVPYTTLAAFSAATGRDTASVSLVGTTGVNSDLTATDQVENLTSSVAQALPGALASVVGQAAGAKHLGAWS